ncbi:MAG TPA: hypothetical protein K8V90_04275 [Romboutsia timonensis]|uniref:Uncharacterized protein n=1 Tax=Romboutsia timonensis TaxID=1776391 RepID=A0A921MZR6_9FIRM|nr:hypothetical protein [Romboutsia timonensis]
MKRIGKLTKYKVLCNTLDVLIKNNIDNRFNDIQEKFNRRESETIQELLSVIDELLESTQDYDTIAYLKVYKKRLEKII